MKARAIAAAVFGALLFGDDTTQRALLRSTKRPRKPRHFLQDPMSSSPKSIAAFVTPTNTSSPSRAGPASGGTFGRRSVTKMIKVFGAPIKEKDANAIVDYLASTYK